MISGFIGFASTEAMSHSNVPFAPLPFFSSVTNFRSLESGYISAAAINFNAYILRQSNILIKHRGKNRVGRNDGLRSVEL